MIPAEEFVFPNILGERFLFGSTLGLWDIQPLGPGVPGNVRGTMLLPGMGFKLTFIVIILVSWTNERMVPGSDHGPFLAAGGSSVNDVKQRPS